MASSGEVTLLLGRIKRGDQDALGQLIPLVYKELRRLAGHYLQDERIGHTLQPTALVHEVFLQLVGLERIDWQDRAHFMAVAARLMRRILVDYARRRKAAKRCTPIAMNVEVFERGTAEGGFDEVLAVDEALTRLGILDPEQSRVVEMRYFGGLTVEEIAEVLGASPRTVKRDWAVAKAWLHTELTGSGTA